MACAYPPELDERELLAYMDGEADVQVVTHLEQCPHCRDRAQRLARLQDRLTAGLYRITCPSPVQLGDYHLGVLAQDQATTVAQHMAHCPHCSREIIQLKGYLGELAADLEFSRSEQIKMLVAQLVSGRQDRDRIQAPAFAPAYAGLRGEECGPCIYQAGDAQIAIEVQDDANQRDRKILVVLITGMDARDWIGNLWQSDQPVTETPVDELGNLVFANLAPGSYELILSGPELEIHIQDLEVGDS